MSTVETTPAAPAAPARKGRPPSQVKQLRTQLVAYVKAMEDAKDLDKLLKRAMQLIAKHNENTSPAPEDSNEPADAPQAEDTKAAVSQAAPVEAPKKRGRKPKPKVEIAAAPVEAPAKLPLLRKPPMPADLENLQKAKAAIEAEIAAAASMANAAAPAQ